MNKKVIGVLTALLIVTMAVPVFADNHMEDNVEITGDVTTVFQTGSYGDEVDAAKELWADDDALDEDYAADKDPDAFPAEKAFYQEIGFNVAGNVNDNINFDLAIDTLANNFTKTEGPTNSAGTILGDQGDGNGQDESNLTMDTALLTISDDVSTLKLGDMGDYHGSVYFIDEEDMEGMELTTAMAGNDLKVFMTSDSDEYAGKDFYGVTLSRDLGAANVTGKMYQGREDGESVTDLAVALDAAVTDTVALNGELVSSDNSVADSGTLMMFGAEMQATDALTLTADMEMAGEDFTAVEHDLEEDNDYDKYAVGGEMALDANNTVTADYTMVTRGDSFNDDEDKSTIELGLENTNGAYTNNASVAMTANDGYNEDTNVTVINLGTEYAMDAATLTADLTNQSSDDNYDNDFTYLTVGLDQQITDNVNWNTSFGYITGTTAGDVDADANDFETSLTVNF